jgi:hypothetical protein
LFFAARLLHRGYLLVLEVCGTLLFFSQSR